MIVVGFVSVGHSAGKGLRVLGPFLGLLYLVVDPACRDAGHVGRRAIRQSIHNMSFARSSRRCLACCGRTGAKTGMTGKIITDRKASIFGGPMEYCQQGRQGGPRRPRF